MATTINQMRKKISRAVRENPKYKTSSRAFNSKTVGRYKRLITQFCQLHIVKTSNWLFSLWRTTSNRGCSPSRIEVDVSLKKIDKSRGTERITLSRLFNEWTCWGYLFLQSSLKENAPQPQRTHFSMLVSRRRKFQQFTESVSRVRATDSIKHSVTFTDKCLAAEKELFTLAVPRNPTDLLQLYNATVLQYKVVCNSRSP